MKRYIGLFLFCLLLFGCRSQSVPGWTITSFSQLERFKELYLAGENTIAEANFRKAIAEIKKSGDLAVLQRAYLVKYALQSAVLDPFDGEDYQEIEKVQAIPENRNFFSFLKGAQPAQISEELLPSQYREVFTVLKQGRGDKCEAAVTKINDPLSRLIAIGWLVKQGQSGESLLLLASDTASRQGWKRALLVYLDRLYVFYLASNDMKKAEVMQQRIRLISN